jgi:hypothetical protein
LLLGMLSAVKLDRELARGAGEINDVRPDRMLAAETVLVQPTGSSRGWRSHV